MDRMVATAKAAKAAKPMPSKEAKTHVCEVRRPSRRSCSLQRETGGPLSKKLGLAFLRRRPTPGHRRLTSDKRLNACSNAATRRAGRTT